MVEVEVVDRTEFDDKSRRRGGGGRLVESDIIFNREPATLAISRRLSADPNSASLLLSLPSGSAVIGRRAMREREVELAGVASLDHPELGSGFMEWGGENLGSCSSSFGRFESGNENVEPGGISCSGLILEILSSSLASSSRDMIACG